MRHPINTLIVWGFILAGASSAAADTDVVGIPTPDTDSHVVTDRSTPPDLNTDRIESCLSNAGTHVFAEFRAFVFTTRGNRARSLDSGVDSFADRAYAAFSEENWFHGDRGVLLVINASDGDTAIQVGNHWESAGFFGAHRGFRQSPLALVDGSQEQRICNLAQQIELRLAKLTRNTEVETELDCHARLNVDLRDTRQIIERGRELRQKADDLAGADSQLFENVLVTTPTKRAALGLRKVAKLRRFCESVSDGGKSDLDVHFSGYRGQLQKWRELNREASNPISKFEKARSKVSTYRYLLSDARTLFNRRSTSTLPWFGKEKAEEKLEECRRGIDRLQGQIDEGGLIDGPSLEGPRACLEEALERIKRQTPLGWVLFSLLPTIVVVAILLGLAAFGNRVLKNRR